MFITQDNIQLVNNSIITFPDTSELLTNSYNIFYVSDQLLSSIDCEFKNVAEHNKSFYFYNVNGQDITTINSLSINDIEYFEYASKYIYKINMLFVPNGNGTRINQHIFNHINELSISIDSKEYLFSISGASEEESPKLKIALQNYKQQLTDDYYTAFKESKLNQEEVPKDQVLLNKKRKEFLLELFNIVGFVGSYKSLLNALDFFGWGDLLELQEYWKSKNTSEYKLTNINNEVVNHLDKSLAGFRKSNQMALVYKINEIDGYDEDGLPYFINVLTNTDEILSKLYALKRILENDFMPLNTKIVDIVGDFNSVIGLEFITWLNDSTLTNSRLNSSIGYPVEASIESKSVHIQNHEVLIDRWLYEPDSNDENLELIGNPNNSIFNQQYFYVEQEVNEDTIFADFDWATRYYSNDFGLIKINLAYDTSQYYKFKYQLLDMDDNILLESAQLENDKLYNNTLYIGVSNQGTYKVNIIVYDYFGGASFIGIDSILITNGALDFYIAKHNVGQHKVPNNINLFTTFKTTVDGYGAPDPISTNLDLNTYDHPTNSLNLPMLNYYDNDFDIDSTYTTINDLKGISLNNLNNIPLATFGYKYGSSIIDIIGDGSDGIRLLGIKKYIGHENNPIELFYSSSTYSSPELFIQQFITQLNSSLLEVYEEFTYDLVYYNNDPTSMVDEGFPMLRIIAKIPGLMVNKFILSVDNISPSIDMPEIFINDDLLVFTRTDASIKLFHNGDDTSGDLLIKLGENEIIKNNVIISNIQEAIHIINDAIDDLELENIFVSIFDATSHIHVHSKLDIVVSHKSFGYHADVIRLNSTEDLYKISIGSDVSVGEPVYAFIDEKTKRNNSNIFWTLVDNFTNNTIVVQNSYAFRWVFKTRGSYNLTLNTIDTYGENVVEKKGCYLVS